jgi:hypothetical protein
MRHASTPSLFWTTTPEEMVGIASLHSALAEAARPIIWREVAVVFDGDRNDAMLNKENLTAPISPLVLEARFRQDATSHVPAEPLGKHNGTKGQLFWRYASLLHESLGRSILADH